MSITSLDNQNTNKSISSLIDLAPGPNRTSRSEVDLASRGRNSSKDEFDLAPGPNRDMRRSEVTQGKISETPNFPEFDQIPVSTKTFIVNTNITIDIAKLYELLPITLYQVEPSRRGRKRRIGIDNNPLAGLPAGSILTIEYGHLLRGVRLKNKKSKSGTRGAFFRNSVTVVMVIDGKTINTKICRNGNLQMTGCKKDSQAEDCVKYLWKHIKNRPVYQLHPIPGYAADTFRALFIPAMRNFDFSIGFVLDREKLDRYFNSETPYNSLLETSIGYTGVNIKIPVRESITSLKLKELIYDTNKDDWGASRQVPYEEYLKTLKPKDQQKRLDKERHVSFLVFHSGNIICSAMCDTFAREPFRIFMDIIKTNAEQFKQK
jgi:hypothetical protein